MDSEEELTFASQEKILSKILKNPANKLCADCNTISPTWASLNFGVFVCSNCSGAHRALGIPVTRVKSVKLDLWKRSWIQNMRIGNTELNAYWEETLTSNNNKPVMGASHNEVNRYVIDKYVKKKYVKDSKQPDPLSSYKNGVYRLQTDQTEEKVEQVSTNKKIQEQIVSEPAKTEIQSKSLSPPNIATKSDNLLDFQESPMVNELSQNLDNVNANNDENQFTEYAQVGTSFTTETNSINFEGLQNQNTVAPPQLHHVQSASNAQFINGGNSYHNAANLHPQHLPVNVLPYHNVHISANVNQPNFKIGAMGEPNNQLNQNISLDTPAELNPKSKSGQSDALSEQWK